MKIEEILIFLKGKRFKRGLKKRIKKAKAFLEVLNASRKEDGLEKKINLKLIKRGS